MGRINAVVSAAVLASAVAAAPLAPSYAGSRGLEPLGPVPSHATAAHRTAPVAPAAVTTGPGTSLGLTSFSDILADPAHGHVFVTGGTGTNGVVVTNLAGTVQQTLGSTPGASGMVLSPDGATLYVALAGGDGIREIDTTTLAGTTVSTGASTCPQDVAVTAGTLWFSYTCQDGQGRVGALDPATSTVHLDVISSGFYGAPRLVASPGLAGALFAGETGQSPARLARYDMTGGDTPSSTLGPKRDDISSTVSDLVVTPDGADVIVASGSPYYHQVFRTSDLANDGTYQTSNYPNAVAVNEDGVVAAGIDGIYSDDIWIYEPGATTALKRFDFGSGDYLQPRGLAFTGQTVYAVSGDFGSTLSLHVLSTKPDAPLTVTTDRSAYKYGAKVKISLHLKTPDAARAVSVYATPAGGATRLVKSGNLSGGAFTATYPVTRLTTFTAVYAGGATYGQTSKTRTVKVHARVVTAALGGYKKSHGYTLFHVRKLPRWVATVSPNHGGECINFVAQQPTRSGGWHTFGSTGCVVLSSTSKGGAVLTGTPVVGGRVRLKAVYGGSSVNLSQASAWSYVRFTR